MKEQDVDYEEDQASKSQWWLVFLLCSRLILCWPASEDMLKLQGVVRVHWDRQCVPASQRVVQVKGVTWSFKILQFQSAQKPLLTGTNVCVITCILCSCVALYTLLSLGIPSLKGQLAISPLFLCGVWCVYSFFFSFRFVLILCMCGFYLHVCAPCLHLIPVEIRNK